MFKCVLVHLENMKCSIETENAHERPAISSIINPIHIIGRRPNLIYKIDLVELKRVLTIQIYFTYQQAAPSQSQ